MNVLTQSFGAALLACFLALHAAPAVAAWNVAIGDASTNGAWSGGSPNVWTPSASGATVAASEIASRLVNGPVSIVTGSTGAESGNIAVNTPVAWAANTLSLAAAGAIKVGAVMAASGSANLTVNRPLDLNISSGGFGGRVDFSGSGALTIENHAYTVIHDVTALQNLVPSDGNRRYALGSQIDATATSGWNGGAGFAPLLFFWGTLDGLGHTITGLTINRPTTDNVGLFSGLVGTARNVALSSASIVGKDYVGLLAGQNAGRISSVHVDGTVSGVSHVGGLVGLSQDEVNDAYTAGNVAGSGTYIGGLVGTNYMPVNRSGSNSVVTGNAKQATGEHLYIGGLIGWNNGSIDGAEIRNSHGNGHVVVNVVETGGNKGFFAGGLVGWNDGTGGVAKIIESYSVARVQGPAATLFGLNFWRYGGGLVGVNEGQFAEVRSSYANAVVWGARLGGGLAGWNRDQALIEDSWASGSVDKTNGEVYYGGGVAAFNSGGATIRRVYSLVKVLVLFRGGGVVAGNGAYQSESSGSFTVLFDNSGVIENAHVAGPGIVATNTSSDIGIAVWNYGSISNAYWDKESTGTTSGVQLPAGSTLGGLTSAQARAQASFAGFDFTNHWVMTEGLTRPLLRNVITADQSITIAMPSVAIGSSDTLTATGGASENPIVFASLTSSVCTVTGATVSGVSGGTCTVSANQAGNANNHPATQATLSFAISSIAANGTCGSAHAVTPLVTSAPIGGALCTHSTASSVTTNPSTFTWTCTGTTTTANCSASRGYTVTSSAVANGSVSGAQVVAHNAQPEFTATPDGGYAVNAWGGTCGGIASGTGNVSYTTSAVTADCDVSVSFSGNASTPNAFNFTAANGVALGTLQTSNTITVAGITTGAAISITGGEYQIGSGSFVSTDGTVNNGDTVTVRHTSSAAFSTATTTTLTIGGVSASYASITLAAPVINGACGASHGTALVTSAPSTSLCSTGNPTSVTTGVSAYSWGCTGSGGGSTASCSASRGYTVTPSAGSNGSISPSGAQVVAYNATPAFTATPASSYAVNAWGGSCGGTASGTGNVSYTTAAVTTDCTVSVSFTGNDSTPDAFSFTAVNGAALSTLQTSNTITVAGINTGAAISITGGEYQVGSDSFVSTGGTVNNGNTVTVRHTSSAVNSTATTTTLTIGTVSANFLSTTLAAVGNGACGSSANAATAFLPTANLCSAGTASTVTPGTSSWAWSCTGTGPGATNATCSAPYPFVNGGGGTVGAIQAQSVDGWQIDQAASGFVPAPAPAPDGVTFPGGATKVVLNAGAAGTSATVTLRFSSIPAGAQLYKYGKENASDVTEKWFLFPATIDVAAGTVTYTLTDGLRGDNDWTANSVIDDPVGLGVAGAGIAGVPTLSQWVMMLLAGLMGWFALGRVRRL